MADRSVLEVAHAYYNATDQQVLPPELVGCLPLGGGGVVEALYRAHAEERHLRRIVRLDRSMNVVELGCGNGRWALAIAPRVATYVGVDFSAAGIGIAQSRAQEANLCNVSFELSSVGDYRSDRQFGLAYFSAVLQYIDDADLVRIVRSLCESLTPDAQILDRSSLASPHRETVNDGRYSSIYRTADELDALFAECGFRRTYRRRSHRYMRHRIWDRLVRRLPGAMRRQVPDYVRASAPFSYQVIATLSRLEDWLWRPAADAHGRSHDFSLYQR
jgi:SAM-dependent methyltransferase